MFAKKLLGVWVIAFGVLSGSAAQADDASSDMVNGAHDWSGFYFGLGAGPSWTGAEYDNFVLNATGTDTSLFSGIDHDFDALAFNGYAGLQHQIGNFVIGVEGSVGTLSGKDVSFGSVDDVYTTEFDNLFTATARLGYSMGNVLAYLKGGYASSQVVATIFDPTPGQIKDSDSNRHHGFIVGGGLDYRLNSFIILGVEYNYIDLESKNIRWVAPDNTVNIGRVTPDAIHTLTAHISFLIGLP